MNQSNFVQLIGHLGKDVELFKKEDSKAVGKVTLATTKRYKNTKGEQVTLTEWHTLVMFGGVAEIAEKYLKKGSHVLVTGSLKTRKYTTKEAVDKYITEIVVDDILFLDRKD